MTEFDNKGSWFLIASIPYLHLCSEPTSIGHNYEYTVLQELHRFTRKNATSNEIYILGYIDYINFITPITILDSSMINHLFFRVHWSKWDKLMIKLFTLSTMLCQQGHSKARLTHQKSAKNCIVRYVNMDSSGLFNGVLFNFLLNHNIGGKYLSLPGRGFKCLHKL